MGISILDRADFRELVVRIIDEAQRTGVEDPALGQLQLIADGVAAPGRFNQSELETNIHRLLRKLSGGSFASSIFFRDMRVELPTLPSEIEGEGCVGGSGDPARMLYELRFLKERISGIAKKMSDDDMKGAHAEFVRTHMDSLSKRFDTSVIMQPRVRLVDRTGTRAFIDRAIRDIDAMETVLNFGYGAALDRFKNRMISDMERAISQSCEVDGLHLQSLAQVIWGDCGIDGLVAFKVKLMEAFIRIYMIVDPYPKAPVGPVLDRKLSKAIEKMIDVGRYIEYIPDSRIAIQHMSRRIAQLEDMRRFPVDIDYASRFVGWVYQDFKRVRSIANAPAKGSAFLSQIYFIEQALQKNRGRVGGECEFERVSSVLEKIDGRIAKLINVGVDADDVRRARIFEDARTGVFRAHIVVSTAIYPYHDEDGGPGRIGGIVESGGDGVSMPPVGGMESAGMGAPEFVQDSFQVCDIVAAGVACFPVFNGARV